MRNLGQTNSDRATRQPGRAWLPRWAALAVLATVLTAPAAHADDAAQPQQQWSLSWLEPERISATLPAILLFSVLTLVPALVLMTTSFVRIVVVLSLLRQALGTTGLPSNQVLSALALFVSLAVMSPVWQSIHDRAIVPYCAREISGQEALQRAQRPAADFMARQIERSGNADDVRLFLRYTTSDPSQITSYDQVPFRALAPAFLLSELKTAFLIGFQLYLPFLVIDLIVSAFIAGMGMVTLPPAVVSLPFKLMLFVLVDGWHLVVGTLMESFV